MVHEIYLTGYSAVCQGGPSSKRLYLGTYGSYGIEQIKLITNSDWDGMTIAVIFNNPNGVCTSLLAIAETPINVPPEATSHSGYGTIVITGMKEGVRRITVDISYKVVKHAPTTDIDTPPTPNIWEQFLNAFPNGGTEGQVLTKRSDKDRDVEWTTIQNGNEECKFPYKIGNGLKVTGNNTLEVNMAEDVEEDNTLPISSAMVYTQIGNIESLLGTI